MRAFAPPSTAIAEIVWPDGKLPSSVVNEYSAWSPFWCSIVFFAGSGKTMLHVRPVSTLRQRLVAGVDPGIPQIESHHIHHRAQVEHATNAPSKVM
jgi:hypothetical protein